MSRLLPAGPWPGTDPRRAVADVLSVVGHPHLPVLPELPARGPGSDPEGRSAAMLEGLAVDLQPYGWRLTAEPGLDHTRAVSALTTDLQALSDVAGESGTELTDVVLRVRGPLSLTAALWLPGGERALIDHGARRDLAQSLAAGLAQAVRSLRAQAAGARVTVVLDEPRAAAVLSGAIPTASGYRTVRSVPRSEAREAWRAAGQSVLDAGATGLVLAPGHAGLGSGTPTGSDTGSDAWNWTQMALLAAEAMPPRPDDAEEGDDGAGGSGALRALTLPPAPLDGPGADPSRWDVIAGWVEAGRQVALALPGPGETTGAGQAHPYRGTAQTVARTWERVGLDPALLARVLLSAPALDRVDRDAALRTLSSAVTAAEDLRRIGEDGGLG